MVVIYGSAGSCLSESSILILTEALSGGCTAVAGADEVISLHHASNNFTTWEI
jgi:hypothetical protein